ncbi:ATP-binding protein [Jongsikchunia kroppenstedtii]|uniref:ATP-binding protein n=1 Tax=Jongsikchunia kroppenstedtii TaxID=1121721 RepID=UPI00036AFD5E|nr:ATP-binding protein [Jongsikchunia kroppenstedtii]
MSESLRAQRADKHRTINIGQYRLTRLQLVNWGTFHGYKDYAIDERGVMLTGPSGSGKSSMMDGHSVVLLPTYDQVFNASADLTAKGAKKAARSMADYVRGAWAENDDQYQQSQVQYLRGDGATWSAIAATYDNGAGSVTTAVAIKWFPAAGTDGSSLRSWYQLHTGEFDLLELNGWAESGFDIRRYRTTHPDVDCFDVQTAYSEALRRRVGIGSSSAALSLMGKAKAMKNVGELNLFIRTYMLDRPETFGKAQRLVENFTQLDEAYQAAARAHSQEKLLRPIPEAWEAFCGAEQSTTRAGALLGAPMRAFMREHRLTLLQNRLDEIDADRLRLDNEVANWENLADEREERHSSLRDQLITEKGELTALESEQKSFEQQMTARNRAYERYAALVHRLGEQTPETQDEFSALRLRAPELGRAADKAAKEMGGKAHLAFTAESDARRSYEAVVEELKTLDARRSLLPRESLMQRDVIANATGIPLAELPFAAELIDVRESEASVWAGAAERILRGLGMSVLVPADRRDTVAEFVNKTNLGGVLEYRIYSPTASVESPVAGTLAEKVAVDLEHPAGRWLSGVVARTADHVCVDSPLQLNDHEVAVTPAGLVKSGRDRYRKDDRRSVSDRTHWILGSNTDGKREALEASQAALRRSYEECRQRSADVRELLDDNRERVKAAEALAGYTSWAELNHWSSRRDAEELNRRIGLVREGRVDLADLEEQVELARTDWREAVARVGALNDQLKHIGSDWDRWFAEFEQVKADGAKLDDDDRDYLGGILTQVLTDSGKVLTLDTYGEVRADLRGALESIQGKANTERDAAESRILRAADAFLREWPEAGTDLSATVDAAPDFVTLHQNLVEHGLASTEGRFRRLITTDISHSVSNLYKEISDTNRRISQGISDVNVGLERVDFNEGTYLQIAAVHNPTDESAQFGKIVDAMIRDAPAAKSGDSAVLARQFYRIRDLVARFTGTDADNRRWSDNVLDVRNSYTFYGKELARGAGLDAAPVHTYRNTATNSGGEQEKLVAFCLAAALSFSLSHGVDSVDSQGNRVHHDELDHRPRFAPLMLDEAFSKSDETFSSQSLQAFEQFGFQLIIAAPIRMVGIVEPFIGQVILVDKKTDKGGARSDARAATFGELAEAQRG